MTSVKQPATMVNAFDPARLGDLDAETRGMIERRMRLLGPAYRLFYEQPLRVERGSGPFLYDQNGVEYLDAYNNVASVGHANPRVAAAIAGQAARLATHTRYVQEPILRYAESILPSFGGRLAEDGHIMFTCTGSEANDLALRIAQHRTGRDGIIITSEAYHGNSQLTAGCSPSLGRRAPLGPWVRQVPTPDSYRLPRETMVPWFVEQVARQIDDLERHGNGIAAFICDSIFSSDGIYDDPVGLLAPVADLVRSRGGVFIADEVQAGFGRTGTAFWGYRRHGVDPDMVTMGKPMGNGFPVAAVAVRPDIIAGFGRDMRYFNTFGGNAVAIAAAQATLDVLRDDALSENAERVGNHIRAGFVRLRHRFPVIGDIRGAGLYVGVEMVTDPASRQPDGALAARIVNGLRDRHILISATGFHANTLKIRPPLVFTTENADRLLDQTEALLDALAG
ncbi:aspartate aminotransferase family protein [Gluconacetobacter sacchari]|uniref:aspartate aminotransferase family protein n=1 Tax=Gluconacetobacter sacchari TaxID=92759 RepID=UPI0039B3EF93